MSAEEPLHDEPQLAHKMQSLLAEAPQVLQPGTPARPAPSALRLAPHLMAAAIPNEPCGRDSSQAAAANMMHSYRACHASATGRTYPDMARQPAIVIGLNSAAITAQGSLESLPSGLFTARNILSASRRHDSIDMLHSVGSPAIAGSSRELDQMPACLRQTLCKLPPASTISQGVQARPAQSPSADHPVSEALPAQAHSVPEADEQWGQLSKLAPMHDTAATPHPEAASASLASGQTAPLYSLHGGASALRHASGTQKPAGNDGSSHSPSTTEPLREGGPSNRPTAEAWQIDGSAGIQSQAEEGSKQAGEARQAQQGRAWPAQAQQGGAKESGVRTETPSEGLAGGEASDVHIALQTA